MACFTNHDKSTGSEHYAVEVLHSDGDSGNGEAWLHVDNVAVSAVQHEDVFDDERVNDECRLFAIVAASELCSQLQ